jgi:hypothetical protein
VRETEVICAGGGKRARVEWKDAAAQAAKGSGGSEGSALLSEEDDVEPSDESWCFRIGAGFDWWRFGMIDLW